MGSLTSKKTPPAERGEPVDGQKFSNRTWCESAVTELDTNSDHTSERRKPHVISNAVEELENVVGTWARKIRANGPNTIETQEESEFKIPTVACNAKDPFGSYHSVDRKEDKKSCENANTLSNQSVPVNIKEELFEADYPDLDCKPLPSDTIFKLQSNPIIRDDLKNKIIKQELIEENSKLTANHYRYIQDNQESIYEKLEDGNLIQTPIGINRRTLVGTEKDDKESLRNVLEYKLLKKEIIEENIEKLDHVKNKIKNTTKWLTNPFAIIASAAKEYSSKSSVHKSNRNEVLTQNSYAEHTEVQDVNTNPLGSSYDNLWVNRFPNIKVEAQYIDCNGPGDFDTDGNSDFHSLHNTSFDSLPPVHDDVQYTETPKWMVKLPQQSCEPLKNVECCVKEKPKVDRKPIKKQVKRTAISESKQPNVIKPKTNRGTQSKTKFSSKFNQKNKTISRETLRKKPQQKRKKRVLVADKAYYCPVRINKLDNTTSHNNTSRMRACKKQFFTPRQLASFPKPFLEQKPQIVTPPAPIKVEEFKSENLDTKREDIGVNYDDTLLLADQSEANNYHMDYSNNCNQGSVTQISHLHELIALESFMKKENNYDTIQFDANLEKMTVTDITKSLNKPNANVLNNFTNSQQIERSKPINLQQPISTRIWGTSFGKKLSLGKGDSTHIPSSIARNWLQNNKLLKSMQPRVCIKRLSLPKHIGSIQIAQASYANLKKECKLNESIYENMANKNFNNEIMENAEFKDSKNSEMFLQLKTNPLSRNVENILNNREVRSAVVKSRQAFPLGGNNKLKKYVDPRSTFSRSDEIDFKNKCIMNVNLEMDSSATLPKKIFSDLENDLKKEILVANADKTPLPFTVSTPIKYQIKNETKTNVSNFYYLQITKPKSALDLQHNCKLWQPKVLMERLSHSIDFSRSQLLNVAKTDNSLNPQCIRINNMNINKLLPSLQPKVRLKRLNFRGTYHHSLLSLPKPELNPKHVHKLNVASVALNLQPVVRLRRLKLFDMNLDYSLNNQTLENHNKHLTVNLEIKRECNVYDMNTAYELRKRSNSDIIHIKEEKLSPKRSADMMTTISNLRISKAFSLHPIVRLKRMKCLSNCNDVKPEGISRQNAHAKELEKHIKMEAFEVNDEQLTPAETQIKMEAFELDDEKLTPACFAKQYLEEDSGISLDSTYDANNTFDSDKTANIDNDEFKQHFERGGILYEIALERACINELLLRHGYSPIHFRLYNDIEDLKIFLNYLLDD